VSGGAITEISVIVPARNAAATVPALLRGLEAQTLPSERFEVIMVDNGSSDGTAQVATAGGARVVRESIANRAGARNRGAREASGRYYAFIDADCIPLPGWLEALTACAHKAPLMAGEVRIRVSKRPSQIERFESLWRFGQEAWVVNQGWAATANLLVHADAFRAIGGFDTSWRKGGEDVDFCFRAREGGYGLGFCREAVVEHSAERAVLPMLRRAFVQGYSINQAFYRWGEGYRAWRDPRPAVHGDVALRRFEHSPDRFDPGEWRRMARLARVEYTGRVLGSLWAELCGVR
jgi:glycosyltransferase involved in cell wall biosynthesis